MINNIALDILDFWFNKSKPEEWFEKNIEYDNLIKIKYESLHEKAIKKGLIYWENTSKESLALIILIDQFSRNIYRNHPNSFKFDLYALNICKKGLKKSYLKELDNTDQKMFFILPLIHSEKLEDQESAINIANDELKKHPNFDKILKFFNRHKEIIEMFNRFPHRNKILNRKSTEKEIAFLKTPFSSF